MSFPVQGTPPMFSHSKERDNLRGFPGSMMCLFVHATVYGELRRSFTSSHSRVAPTIIRALIADALVLASVCVKTLADRDGISGLYHLSGIHGIPYSLHDSLCTLRAPCSPTFLRLRHARNTRYGWLARPYPTGTCTLQGTPGFAWRAPMKLTDIMVSFLLVVAAECPLLRR